MFNRNENCELCPLHLSAEHSRCIPSRVYFKGSEKMDRAILIVGEAPGFYEDLQDECWVGKTGQLLNGFVDKSELWKHGDIYYANSCRCRPTQNDTPTNGQINKCRVYLQQDLDELTEQYKEVVILASGRPAVYATTRTGSLKDAFSRQGQRLKDFPNVALVNNNEDTECRVFFTYHPAMLWRSPAKLQAVTAHYTLLVRYLKGGYVPNTLVVVPEVNDCVPAVIPPLVCVDIETYGILKGVNQTVFHPMKSQEVDGVPIGQQIVTVSFGWKVGNRKYKTPLYRWDHELERRKVLAWFRAIAETGTTLTTLLGQNIKYDLQYLWWNDVRLRSYINPLRLRIDDTLLGSFLYYEQRPEKGLKELAILFGITDYSRLEVTGSSGTAKNSSDTRLHYYNCLDVATTLALFEFTWGQIEEKYGKDSYKLSKTCSDMRNEVLWGVILMEQHGVYMDRKALLKIHKEYGKKCEASMAMAEEKGIILRGTGSQKSTLNFMTNSLEAVGLGGSSNVQLTEKKKEISVCKNNFTLLASNSTLEHDHWCTLAALRSYHANDKILNTYTSKLLYDKKKGLVRGNVTYPSWYPLPSRIGKQESVEGGTIQGRLSCKAPPQQTFPKLIKNTLISRFPYGKIVGYDLSQIELRLAALLSNDPVMIQEYVDGIDRHTETAFLINPNADIMADDFHDRWRWAGKQLNFLIIYLGQALKFQETCLHDAGILLPLEQCQNAIQLVDNKYLVFRAWQQELIADVREKGYMELFTGWSRTFGKGLSADAYINEIVNFPIQTTAAQLLQSAQYAINCEFLRQRMRSIIALQIHDAVYVDMPMEEEKKVDKIVEKYLTNPPLLGILNNILERSIPLEYEKQE